MHHWLGDVSFGMFTVVDNGCKMMDSESIALWEFRHAKERGQLCNLLVVNFTVSMHVCM